MNKRTWTGIIVAPLIAPILYQLGLIIFEYESVNRSLGCPGSPPCKSLILGVWYRFFPVQARAGISADRPWFDRNELTRLALEAGTSHSVTGGFQLSRSGVNSRRGFTNTERQVSTSPLLLRIKRHHNHHLQFGSVSEEALPEGLIESLCKAEV